MVFNSHLCLQKFNFMKSIQNKTCRIEFSSGISRLTHDDVDSKRTTGIIPRVVEESVRNDSGTDTKEVVWLMASLSQCNSTRKVGSRGLCPRCNSTRSTKLNYTNNTDWTVGNNWWGCVLWKLKVVITWLNPLNNVVNILEVCQTQTNRKGTGK